MCKCQICTTLNHIDVYLYGPVTVSPAAVLSATWDQGCDWLVLTCALSPPPPEKLAHAKEENLDMHQTLDQTLQELNNL